MSPPLPTDRADFQQWAYLLASDQGLCEAENWKVLCVLSVSVCGRVWRVGARPVGPQRHVFIPKIGPRAFSHVGCG